MPYWYLFLKKNTSKYFKCYTWSDIVLSRTYYITMTSSIAVIYVMASWDKVLLQQEKLKRLLKKFMIHFT